MEVQGKAFEKIIIRFSKIEEALKEGGEEHEGGKANHG